MIFVAVGLQIRPNKGNGTKSTRQKMLVFVAVGRITNPTEQGIRPNKVTNPPKQKTVSKKLQSYLL